MYPSTSLRKERQSKPLSTRPSSPHPTMTSQSSLKEGKLKEETPKTKETCQKDGKGLLPSKKQATIFKKVKQKEEDADSFIPFAMTYNLSFRR